MTDLVLALSAVFITAGAFLLVANHLSLSPVPFYILAGILVGTFVGEPEMIELAQWGIAFLVFVFGVNIEVAGVREVLRDSEFATAIQFVVIAPFGFALGLLLGFDVQNATYIAIAVTLSSTIVGMEPLEEDIRENLVHGRLARSIHFVQDGIAIVIILVLSTEAFTATEITSNLGYGVLFLIAAVIVSRYLYPLLHRVTRGSNELLLMGTISVLIGFLAAAELLGLSIVIGAFAAGLGIRPDYTESLEMLNGIESIRDFFVAIFFVTLGALVSLDGILGFDLEMIVLAALLVLTVVVLKPLVTMAAVLYEGYDPRAAFLTGNSLNQVSEFTLIIAIEALLIGAIAPELFDAIILAAAISMIVATVALKQKAWPAGEFIQSIFTNQQGRKLDERSSVHDDLSGHVIVIGFGRHGKRLVEECRRIDVPYLVIENDPTQWRSIRRECSNYVLGDAIAPYTLEQARVDTAELIISTAAQHRISKELLDRQPDTEVVVRADKSVRAREYLDRGAKYVIVPNILASDHLKNIIERLLSGDETDEHLRRRHLETLAIIETRGVTIGRIDDIALDDSET